MKGNIPKFIDFGIAHEVKAGQLTKQLDTTGDDAFGTIPWMARELCGPFANKRKFYTMASDMWSLGMTIYVRVWKHLRLHSSCLPSLQEMVTVRNPFYHLTEKSEEFEDPDFNILTLKASIFTGRTPLWPQDVRWYTRKHYSTTLVETKDVHRSIRNDLPFLKLLWSDCCKFREKKRSSADDVVYKLRKHLGCI